MLKDLKIKVSRNDSSIYIRNQEVEQGQCPSKTLPPFILSFLISNRIKKNDCVAIRALQRENKQPYPAAKLKNMICLKNCCKLFTAMPKLDLVYFIDCKDNLFFK